VPPCNSCAEASAAAAKGRTKEKHAHALKKAQIEKRKGKDRAVSRDQKIEKRK
jgi:hypothetical protein